MATLGRKPGYRNYSESEKAGALAYVTVLKGNYPAAAKATGIPATTLRSWHKREYGIAPDTERKFTLIKAEFADKLLKLALRVTDSIDDELINSSSLTQRMMSIGIAIDKASCLTDQQREEDVINATIDAQRSGTEGATEGIGPESTPETGDTSDTDEPSSSN